MEDFPHLSMVVCLHPNMAVRPLLSMGDYPRPNMEVCQLLSMVDCLHPNMVDFRLFNTVDCLRPNIEDFPLPNTGVYLRLLEGECLRPRQMYIEAIFHHGPISSENLKHEVMVGHQS